MINIIDTIAYQIEILAASIGKALSFMVAIANQIEFNLYSAETDSLSFHLTTNNIHDNHLIIFVLNSNVTIIFHMLHMDAGWG